MVHKQSAVQLWSGMAGVVKPAVIRMLQSCLASTCKGCGTCTVCLQVAHKKSLFVTWHTPQGVYTREQVEEIVRPLSFVLEESEQRFVIFEAAEQLLSASANSLLKLFEEPPRGWVILLLSERPGLLLPTIRSRCVEHVVSGNVKSDASEGLVAWLSNPAGTDWSVASSALDALRKTPLEITGTLDHLIILWHDKMHTTRDAEQLFAQRMIYTLTASYEHIPHSGNGLNFWRALCIAIRRELER